MSIHFKVKQFKKINHAEHGLSEPITLEGLTETYNSSVSDKPIPRVTNHVNLLMFVNHYSLSSLCEPVPCITRNQRNKYSDSMICFTTQGIVMLVYPGLFMHFRIKCLCQIAFINAACSRNTQNRGTYS